MPHNNEDHKKLRKQGNKISAILTSSSNATSEITRILIPRVFNEGVVSHATSLRVPRYQVFHNFISRALLSSNGGGGGGGGGGGRVV